MHNKEFALAISLGGDENDYVTIGETGFSMDEIIAPFKASINFIHAKLLPHTTSDIALPIIQTLNL